MATIDVRTLYGTPHRVSNASKTVEKEATVADLTWVDTTHKIGEIVSRSPPLLPILIKCDGMSSDPYIATKIQPGDIMKLSRLQTIDIVQATVEFKSSAAEHLKGMDEYNGIHLPSFLAIPKSMESISFEVVRGSVRYSTPLGFQDSLKPFSKRSSILKGNRSSVRFKTVKELSNHLPRFVKVIKASRKIRQNTKIVDGHVLEVMGIHSPWATRDKYLSCRIDQPDGQVCKLDLKWNGIFDTIPDMKRYNIQDLLRVYRLPITVRVRDFSPSEWVPQKTSSQLKAIKTLDLNLTIEKEETVEFAMAITNNLISPSSAASGACRDQNDSRLMVLSKNIDVNFVTSSDMTKSPRRYAEVMNQMGNIGDSMISMLSKDIYFNEYGSPMAVLVPFSDIQPKIYGTPEKALSRPSYLREHDTERRRTSSHHYIDLDVTSEEGGEGEDDTVGDERTLGGADPDDPYVSLGAIRRKEERDKSVSPLKEGGFANCSQSLDDEFGTDYTILRSPLVPGMVPSPSLKSILRFTQDLTESSSYYQVPKNRSIDEDIYIDEDGASSQSDDEELQELKTTGVPGNFPRKSLRSRCPDSLPRNAPPPIPDRSPLYRRESTPITLGGFTQRTASTLGASMVNGLGRNTLSPATPVSRKDTSAVNKTSMDTVMSSLLFEFRARHSVTNFSSATVDGQNSLTGLSGNQPIDMIDDIPPPLPPPRQTIAPYPEKVQETSPSPPPPSPPSPTPSSSSSSSPSPPPPPLPSPPSEDGVKDLSELPLADFPPPLPARSLSLASLSSLTSGVSAASVASVDSVKSATSVESLTSLSSSTGLPMSDSQSFPDSIKTMTLKANDLNRYPTFSTMRHKRTETLGRMHEKGSVSLGRSVSCLSPHGHRNLAAANRKLPPLPMSNKQSEVSPISDYTLEPKATPPRRQRPFSSENILEGSRDLPPPLPADRSSSMENLLRHNRGNAHSHEVPATGPATPPRMSATPSKSSVKVKRQRSYFPSNRSRASTIQKPQIPTANIAPRPSPLSNIMLSLSKSHDGAIPRRHDPLPSHPATSTEDGDSDGNSDDDSDDDGDHNYLYPEAPTYDDTQTYSSNRAALNATPPTVPARIAKKSASLPRSCIKNLKDVPVDIATLSCDQIAQALRLLNIRDDIIDKLRSEKMNGELLKSMSEEILRTEFHMSQFHAIKVIKFVNGWRP
ncbi:uncharacterized protein LOC121430954 [Lytechinus variegatus]|uniref:uncharacterized protein LOC121430954 n=1 Tax=Lytechinus variegatus TaxID=7654 RepID=UPI001BB1C097|nr:uncharacterized protein LOC121430954 [Lytechinus variegatus]